jgi:hypothetical protein
MYFAAAVLTVLAGLFYAAGNQSVHMVRTSAVRAARSAPHYVLVGAGLAASGAPSSASNAPATALVWLAHCY